METPDWTPDIKHSKDMVGSNMGNGTVFLRDLPETINRLFQKHFTSIHWNVLKTMWETKDQENFHQ